MYGTSQLVRYVSSGRDPAGPYRRAETVRRGFRADLKRHPVTGAMLLLTTGIADPGSPTCCERGMLIRHWTNGSVLGAWTDTMVYGFTPNGHGNDNTQWYLALPHDGWLYQCTLPNHRRPKCQSSPESRLPHTRALARMYPD